VTPRSYSPPPGQQVHLADYDPDDTGGLTEDAGKVLRDELTERLGDLQDKLFADARHAVLIVLQAMDAAGMNSTCIRDF
jgi:polyphosphate kinase 2 (PPK2 family)